MSTALVKQGSDVIDATTGEVVSLAPAFDLADYLASVSAPAALAIQQKLAAAYDAACAQLIGPNDVQREAGRTFKRKSAWRKLARHFGLSTEVVRVERERVGEDFLATVTVRARAPWGQHAEAVGACGTDEATGRRTISIADAIATAETRATNRAISNLIAMGEVSAEEVQRTQQDAGASASRTEPPVSARAAHQGLDPEQPPCPKCGGRMWDNRKDKKNPKAPDFKCRDRSCDGAVWPPKLGAAKAPVRGNAMDPEDVPPAPPMDVYEAEGGLPF